MRNQVLCGFLLSWVVPVLGQPSRWSKTYDVASSPDVLTSVVVTLDGYRFVNKKVDGSVGGGFFFTSINSDGDTMFTRSFPTPGTNQYGGSSQAMMQLSGSGFVMADTRLPIGGGVERDGVLVRFTPDGDTLWTKTYGSPGVDGFMAMDTVENSGFALMGSIALGQHYDMRLIRTDTAGNVLWDQHYGGPEDQQCYSGQRTLDGGFIMAGFKYFNNTRMNMYVVKVDSLGNQQWDMAYGSPWIDNVGFIRQLPDSGYILAGSRVLTGTDYLRSTFYRLDAGGGVIWSSVATDALSRNVLFTVPVVCWDGYVAAGSVMIGGRTNGMLYKVDLNGTTLWRRSYQTNTQTDHYFYDVERTLDGGYIMAGTAFDSLLVSQDAWLVKVDSFGCLVPGCQIFDGLQEQFTDLTNALSLYPNPVAAGSLLQVGIDLPPGFNTTGALSLGLVSSEGRLVHEQLLPTNATRAELPTTDLAPGLYFVHLRDGARWLSGGKVVVTPP